jgi:protein phosphatase
MEIDYMQYAAITEPGSANQNQDYYIIEKINDLYLFAIADGIGGLSHGETASKIAIVELTNNIQKLGKEGLVRGIIQANTCIFQKAKKENKTMGSTLIACLLDKNKNECIIGHIGDSRAYIFNKHLWISTDHRVVMELVELGIISKDGAFSHPERHRLQRALGIQENVKVDIHTDRIKNMDLLLCSDGLSDFVRDDEIKKFVKEYQPKIACKKLFDIARKNGSEDDITIIVVKNE